MQLAVFDIGGTSIKYGVVNQLGEILMEDSFPTDAHLGASNILGRLINTSRGLKEEWTLEGIAISSAGQINTMEGTVAYATENIPGYTGVAVTETIERATNLPVTIENDVNCTALGEYWKGASMGVKNFICLTIGTGIGGALFLNGELYRGSTFGAGEIGHIPLYSNGRPCTCGRNGCYEQYASSKALQEVVVETYNQDIGLVEFFERVRSGDDTGLSIFKQWVQDVATGLVSIVHMCNPELIVIGGGISAQGDFLKDAIRDELYTMVLPNHQKKLRVEIAEHRNQANLLGATKHFLQSKAIDQELL